MRVYSVRHFECLNRALILHSIDVDLRILKLLLKLLFKLNGCESTSTTLKCPFHSKEQQSFLGKARKMYPTLVLLAPL